MITKIDELNIGKLKIDELNIKSLKVDELNVKALPLDEFNIDLSALDEIVYANADIATKSITQYASKRFRKARTDMQTHIAYNVSKSLYSDLYKTDRKVYMQMAKAQYKRFGGLKGIDYAWLEDYLKDDDPVTLYIFNKEMERKRQRFLESISAKDDAKNYKKALKYFVDMSRQYADIISDKAMLQAFKDRGFKKVVWITERDDRVCEKCSPLHGKIFDIDKVPDKQHWGCRCYILPYSTEK